jgi:hypothetical protein
MLRRPDSIPAGDTVIADPVMEPFFISKSQSGGYTVYERVVKGENNTEYIKTVSYPATFNSALKRVVNEKLNNGENKLYNLKDYVNRYENIYNSVKALTTMEL